MAGTRGMMLFVLTRGFLILRFQNFIETIFMQRSAVKKIKNSSNGNGQSKYPEPGSKQEKQVFKKLQNRLRSHFDIVFSDRLAPCTVVVIPSLSMDQEILSKISGINHYEERLLCMLLLLRMPRTNVIYVTSETIDPVTIDYYLHSLPGVTGYHAIRRLTLLSCNDSSSKPLTQKILERPRLIERIRQAILPDHEAHMACFNVTSLERTLSVQLQVPVFGCDPDLYELGNKSNGRRIFRECGLQVPFGFEDLHSTRDIVEGLTALKKQDREIKRAVVKVNDGFSGDGNAIFSFSGSAKKGDSKNWIRENLRQNLKIVSDDLSYDLFMEKYKQMGGIAEAFVEGKEKRSPSVQCRIMPNGLCEVLSTHDQELGGESGQVYIGAHFPASKEYAIDIGKMGKKVAEVLRNKGVLGRFAIDFISVREKKRWTHYPIEINLRKGGTTHPYVTLQFLTDGNYKADEGLYYTANGQVRYYFCSDNLKSEQFHGLTPHDLIDIAMLHDIHYDGTSQEGVLFHLIGALSQFGKLGVVCIGNSPERAVEYYNKTVEALQLETVHPLHTH
jgi:PGM1 C-terminal domain